MKSFSIPDNNLPKIVVLGAGFAGLNFIKHLANKEVQVILIDQNNFHQFQPLLYQVAISGLEPDAIISPIRKLIKSSANMIYRMADVERIDTEIKRVETDKGYVDYDQLVIATGSSTNFYGAKNIEKNSIGLKTIHDALNIRSWMLQNLEKAVDAKSEEDKGYLTRFVIVGGGPAGVEMAGALAEFKKFLLQSDYPEIHVEAMHIYLVQSANKVLPAMSERASSHALNLLKSLDVNVLLNTRVKDYDGKKLLMKTQTGEGTIITNNVIWTAGVKGNTINGIPETALMKNFRIKVDTNSKVEGLENVYAIGDVAAMVTEDNPHGHPMVAQVAIQQGELLAKNVLAALKTGKFEKTFVYNDKGSMATIGAKDAVADLNNNNTFLNGKIGWVLWSLIHLISITGSSNRFKVAFNWFMRYFSYEKMNQLIVRKYSRKDR